MNNRKTLYKLWIENEIIMSPLHKNYRETAKPTVECYRMQIFSARQQETGLLAQVDENDISHSPSPVQCRINLVKEKK